MGTPQGTPLLSPRDSPRRPFLSRGLRRRPRPSLTLSTHSFETFILSNSHGGGNFRNSDVGCRWRARERGRGVARARALSPQPHSARSSTHLERISLYARGRREPTGRATAGSGAKPLEERAFIFSYTPPHLWLLRASELSKHTPPLPRNALHTCRFQS